MPVPMHAERTVDPDIVRWVVRFEGLDALPVELHRRTDSAAPTVARLLFAVEPSVVAVELGAGSVAVVKHPDASWNVVAPVAQQVIREVAEAGALLLGTGGCIPSAAGVSVSVSPLPAGQNACGTASGCQACHHRG